MYCIVPTTVPATVTGEAILATVATAENAGCGRLRAGGERLQFGESEVQQLRHPAFGQHHVAGFQVAVHDAAAVRLV